RRHGDDPAAARDGVDEPRAEPCERQQRDEHAIGRHVPGSCSWACSWEWTAAGRPAAPLPARDDAATDALVVDRAQPALLERRHALALQPARRPLARARAGVARLRQPPLGAALPVAVEARLALARVLARAARRDGRGAATALAVAAALGVCLLEPVVEQQRR